LAQTTRKWFIGAKLEIYSF